MGTHYVIFDRKGRNGLDIGKFHALAVVAGCAENRTKKPLTVEQVREAAKGWLMDWAGMQEPRFTMEDVPFSTRLSAKVEHWIAEVTDGRPLTICEESCAPWGSWQGDDPRAKSWTLWTLYSHPMHNGDAAPPWRLFPMKAPR